VPRCRWPAVAACTRTRFRRTASHDADHARLKLREKRRYVCMAQSVAYHEGSPCELAHHEHGTDSWRDPVHHRLIYIAGCGISLRGLQTGVKSRTSFVLSVPGSHARPLGSPIEKSAGFFCGHAPSTRLRLNNPTANPAHRSAPADGLRLATKPRRHTEHATDSEPGLRRSFGFGIFCHQARSTGIPT